MMLLFYIIFQIATVGQVDCSTMFKLYEKRKDRPDRVGKVTYKKLIDLPDSPECLIFTWSYDSTVQLSINTYKIVPQTTKIKILE
jgi:hypothetical protein